jgi:hypothetical protein
MPASMRSKRSIAAASDSSDASSKNTPPKGGTVSKAPPRPRAITGFPLASASTGVIPKSSSPGSRSARQQAYKSPSSSSVTRPRNRIWGAAMRRSLRYSGPSPAIVRRRPVRENRRTASSMRL